MVKFDPSRVSLFCFSSSFQLKKRLHTGILSIPLDTQMTQQGPCIACNPLSLVESTGIQYRGHINLKWSNLTHQKSLDFGFLEITVNLKKYHVEFGPGISTLLHYKTYEINKWSFHKVWVSQICTSKWLFYIVKCQKCCFQRICLSTFLAPEAYLMVHMAQYTLEFHPRT